MENPEVIQPGDGTATEQNEDSIGFVFSGIYGWVLLLVAVGLIAVWKKLAEPYYQQLQRTRNANREANHRDDEAGLLRERAVEASRLRLQAQMDAAVERHKEKLEEREEAKRQARLLVYENMKKGKSSSSPGTSQEQADSVGPSQKKPKEGRLRGDYFPLMGTETCFRSSRRGGGSAGG